MEKQGKRDFKKENIALVQELILRKEARDASVNLVLQEQFYQYIQEIVNGKEGEISSLEEAFDDDVESIITNERYSYITSVIDDCLKKCKIRKTYDFR